MVTGIHPNFHGDKKAIYFYQKHPCKFLYIASPLQKCNLVGFVSVLYFLLIKGRKKDNPYTHLTYFNILVT